MVSIIPQDAGMRDKTKYATIGSATSSAIKNATLPLILEAIQFWEAWPLRPSGPLGVLYGWFLF